MKRKEFINTSIFATAGLSFNGNIFAGNAVPQQQEVAAPQLQIVSEKMQVCIFSKQLQWLNYADMAKAVADMGYDGIDLTVRTDGHVIPANVETDLPKAVEAAEKAGIKIIMISTDISDARGANTEKVLKTAASLKIRHYRINGLNYQKDIDVPANLDLIKNKFSGIEKLNRQYGLRSDYLNHSGENFGASIWDLWLTIKDLDPAFIGSQFDIKHSTIAGPFSWPTAFKLINKYIQTMVVRDFQWEKKEDKLAVKPVPLGQGLVDFKKYFGLIKQYQVPGPISVMCDYDLGGAENGARILTVPKESVLNAMKKDLDILKTYLAAAGL